MSAAAVGKFAPMESVVAPEVDRLAGGVDLRLVDSFGLTEHCGRIDGVPPLPRQQRGGAEQDRRALVIRGGRPCPASLEGGVDGVGEVFV
jgi:hypothetical protein